MFIFIKKDKNILKLNMHDFWGAPAYFKMASLSINIILLILVFFPILLAQKLDKLLLTAAIDQRRSLVIDLADPDNVCDDFPSYPGHGATGGLLDGEKIFICGGVGDPNPDLITHCYVLGENATAATLLDKK